MGFFDFIGDAVDSVTSSIGDVWDTITGQTAANNAASTIASSNQSAIDTINEALSSYTDSLSSYSDAGTTALSQLLALSGASGSEAQQEAYDALESSAGYQSELAAGETSILQNASATGCLRGGNTQSALAEYASELLSDYASDQTDTLSSLTNLGYSATTSAGDASTSAASSIASLLSDTGTAEANAELAGYSNVTSFLSDLLNTGINIAGLF